MFLLSIAFTQTAAGTLLVLTGIMIRVIIAKRRFDRRGIGGLEGFPSYWAALLIHTLEFLLGIAGLLMIASGLLLLIISA